MVKNKRKLRDIQVTSNAEEELKVLSEADHQKRRKVMVR